MKRGFLKLLTPQNIIAFISVVCGALFWVFTMNGIPKRVDNHDERITVLEHNDIEFKTKQDLMLQAIYETRNDVKQILKDVK